MNRLISVITLGMASLLLTGCVTGTRQLDPVAPDYAAGQSASGALQVAAITDRRAFEVRPKQPSTPSVNGDLDAVSAAQRARLIGRQRNSYGRAMGDVMLPGGLTVMDKTRELLENGFAGRGYTVTADAAAPVQVQATVDEFWGWFRPGFWTVSVQAKMAATLVIADSRGEQRITVQGYGKKTGMSGGNANWQQAFERAMADFLQNLDRQLDVLGL